MAPTSDTRHVTTFRPLMVQEGPEGFSIEAVFCLFYIGLSLYIVLSVAAISMVPTGNTRKYRKRKSMSLDPEAPRCECGDYKCQKSEGRFRKKCYRCRTNKDGASAAATGRSSNTETEAGFSNSLALVANESSIYLALSSRQLAGTHSQGTDHGNLGTENGQFQ